MLHSLVDHLVNIITGGRLKALQEQLDQARRNDARLMADLDIEFQNNNKTARELREARMSRDAYRQVTLELRRRRQQEASERLIESLRHELAFRDACNGRSPATVHSPLREEAQVR